MKKAVRSIHRYFGLFLLPWLIMYGTSGFFMNHREYVNNTLLKGKFAVEVPEKTVPYDGTFPEDAPPRIIAEQILDDLGYSGSFNANINGGRIVFNRIDPIVPRRFVYDPEEKTVSIFRRQLSIPAIFNGIHHRRGYQHERFVDDAWAFSVDISILSLFLLPLTGVLMWRRFGGLRRNGLILLGAGLAMFVMFVVLV